MLTVEIRKIQFINYANIEDFEELEQAGYEKDMSDMIMEKPHMIEDGFIPTTREYSVEHGFIDILGKDKDNNLMVLELKEKKKIRGLLVAPSIMNDAEELLEEEGIEFVAVEPPRELKRDKKITLDAF